jgi:hypothetical protein
MGTRASSDLALDLALARGMSVGAGSPSSDRTREGVCRGTLHGTIWPIDRISFQRASRKSQGGANRRGARCSPFRTDSALVELEDARAM